MYNSPNNGAKEEQIWLILKNETVAAELYTKAAELGDLDSKKRLQDLVDNGYYPRG